MKHFEAPKPWTSEQIVRLAECAPAAKAADWPGIAHGCGHSPGSCRTTWVNLRAHLAAGKRLDSFGNGSRHNRKRIWTTGEKAKLYDLRVIGKKTFPDIDAALGRTRGASCAKFNEVFGPAMDARADRTVPAPKTIHAPKHQPQHKDLTAAFFGDPLPGRSALDRRLAGMAEPALHLGTAARYPAPITLPTEPLLDPQP